MSVSGNDISVIIPVYNREDSLRATLDSVASQTVMPREIIIVDNNSTDGSMTVARQFASEFDGCNVVITSCAIKGAATARNAGAAIASGNYLLFFDSDDVMYATLIATYCDALRDDDSAKIIVVPQHFRLLGGKQIVVNHPLHGDAVASQILHAIITTNNMLVARTAFFEVGEWDVDLPSWNDWELGLRLLLRFRHETRFLSHAAPQLCHIVQEKSITGTGFSHHLDKCVAAISAAETDICVAPAEKRQLYALLLTYKRIMLAAQVSREGDNRGHNLRIEVLASLPSRSLHAMFSLIYRYIASGLPGGSRVALALSRIYLKLK